MEGVGGGKGGGGGYSTMILYFEDAETEPRAEASFQHMIDRPRNKGNLFQESRHFISLFPHPDSYQSAPRPDPSRNQPPLAAQQGHRDAI